ncbi:MAG TPA: transcriptional regulator [Anaerolineaceae bacterium]|nr:transcriptional regulator [Anaerolineaceae bacterium]
MKEELFRELIQSVEEGAQILKGQIKPSRIFTITPLSIKEIRLGYNLTQAEFAQLLDVSLRTYQNWEQGRRKPEGPAKVLLRVASLHPEALLDTVHRMNG